MDFANIKKAYEHVLQTMTEHSVYGAADTEPRQTLHTILRTYMTDSEYQFEDLTPNQWDLYTITKPCEGTADKLNATTKQLLEVIGNSSYPDVMRFKAWLE